MIRQMTPPSWDGDVTRVTNAVTEIVTAGLWIVTENRYEIRNWEKYNVRDKNAPKKDVTAAERMKKYRARLKVKDELNDSQSDKKRNVTDRNESNVTRYASLTREATGTGPIPLPTPHPNPIPPKKVKTTQRLGDAENSDGSQENQNPAETKTPKGGVEPSALGNPAGPEASPEPPEIDRTAKGAPKIALSAPKVVKPWEAECRDPRPGELESWLAELKTAKGAA
jgi:hypothetical protein